MEMYYKYRQSHKYQSHDFHLKATPNSTLHK